MEIYITNTQEYDFGKTESYSERSTKMDALKISELEFDIKYADGTDKHVNEGILIEFNKEKITGHFGTGKLKHLFAAIEALEEMVQAIGKVDLYRKYRGFPEEELTGMELAAIATMLRELESYKETGLTPDQIREMDKLYTEKCKELAAERAKNKWIPCSEKLPENEQTVEITFVRKRWKTGEKMFLTARAFYTDGTTTTEESDYVWEETDNWEYDEEKESHIIPEGWWESVTFSEQSDAVDMAVIAWRPLPEPYIPEDKCHGCFGVANNDCRFCGDDGK